LAGGRLDLEPLLGAGSSPGNTEKDNRTTTSSVVDNKGSGSAPGALYIDAARLDKIFFSQGRFLENVSLA
jgi:hypothetical protein